ncbi:MAG: DegQ family serine endoprotease [Candidatus Aminicenantales bacterium]
MRKIIWIAIVSFFCGVLLAGFVFVYLPDKKVEQSFLNAPSSSLGSNLFASSAQIKPDLDFVKISENVGPAVVKIESERVEKQTVRGFEDSPFEDFWDRFFGRPSQREQEYRTMSQGTGFYISSDGYIITNNHLVEKAVKVTVTSTRGENYTAKVIGTDPKSDLALIKVDAKNVRFVELGDSSQLKVGEWVLAIGNPLGMEHTVTAGIVSAKGRQLGTGMNVPDYQDFIQTDAAINRGNSGGPLVNMKGEVIGITSNILSPTGGNIGIGFAIPSHLAKKVVTQLKEKGRVIRGYLGVTIMAISEDEKKILNLKSSRGALINSVESGGPADKTGLKQYDVIIEINGQLVEDPNDLKFKIADIQPGTKVNIKIIRDGKEKILTATITELESEEERETAAVSGRDIGFSVAPMTPRLARRYGYRTQEGLVITEVRRYSEAERKGIQPGDIILEVNRKKITSEKDLEDILKMTKSGDPIMLSIRREDRQGGYDDYIVTIKVP